MLRHTSRIFYCMLAHHCMQMRSVWFCVMHSATLGGIGLGGTTVHFDCMSVNCISLHAPHTASECISPCAHAKCCMNAHCACMSAISHLAACVFHHCGCMLAHDSAWDHTAFRLHQVSRILGASHPHSQVRRISIQFYQAALLGCISSA